MGEYDQHLLGKQGRFKKECVPKSLFRLGQIVGTQGALQALIEAQQPPDELLHRHHKGDCGDLFLSARISKNRVDFLRAKRGRLKKGLGASTNNNIVRHIIYTNNSMGFHESLVINESRLVKNYANKNMIRSFRLFT